ncbi:MAG: hypothetical protein HY647_05615 [Acidobacteria bacterium]|nr:hypothetical protein [Acidobacteriota bacterium]
MENYFNYFTEIEEYYWKKRGTSLLLSTLDWALIDSWKEAQIPVEAVLKGIDRSFEKFEARRRKLRKVNSLAYCYQEVLAAAEELQRSALHHPSAGEPFPRDALVNFFERNAASLEHAREQFSGQGRPESAETLRSLAVSLRGLAAEARSGTAMNLEEVERRLTVLEDKMFSVLLQAVEESDLVAIRREMDQALRPVRQNMATDQIAKLERQFLQRKLLEKASLPRLSLFYLR